MNANAAPIVARSSVPASRATRSRTGARSSTNAMASIDVMDPSSDLARWEDSIRREEALVQGRAEAQSTRLEDQFAELEDHGADAEVEARLQALKNQQG